MKTRAQRDLEQAERLVRSVLNEQPEVRKIYGGLCHSFPVLVRTCGLCQALAFSEAKAAASGDEQGHSRQRAHELLLKHVAEVLGLRGREELLKAVQQAPVTDYMRQTRRILECWVYFKRFAVSILKVESAQEAEEAVR